MFSLLAIGILYGIVALVAYELIDEIRGSKHKLVDRYHSE